MHSACYSRRGGLRLQRRVRGLGPRDAVDRLPVEETRGWAILADGRVKPLLTYANETALALTGRESLDGLSSLEILWGYILASDDFRNRPYLRIDSLRPEGEAGARRQPEALLRSTTLMESPPFRSLVEEALRHQQAGEELSGLEKDALDVYAKLDRVAGLIRGDALTIVPILDESGGWSSPNALRERRGSRREGDLPRLRAARCRLRREGRARPSARPARG